MKNIRYIAYARKSSEDKDRQALSIPAQIDEMKRQFSELDIIDFVSEEKSAFIPFNRPLFDSMVERVRNGEAQGLISWHPDRLSRNEIDASTITYMLRTGELQDLKFGSFYFQNSPDGIWMLQNALTQSQYYSSKLSVDVKRGNNKKLQFGDLPGMAPQGYINTKDFKGRHYVDVDKDRFELVRKMWKMLLSGAYSPAEIRYIANEEWGYTNIRRARSGGKPLSRSALYHIFNNPFYTGFILRKGNLFEGSHAPMITEEEFERAQKMLGKKGRPRFSTKHSFTYSGRLHCGECGCQITASASKGHTYYYCTRKRKDTICSQRGTVREETLDSQISEVLGEYTILPEFKEWALDVIRSQNGKESEERETVYEMQHKAVVDTQKQLDKVVDMATRELIDEDTFKNKSSELKNRLESLKEHLRDTENRADLWQDTIEQTLDFATHAQERFDNGDMETKRSILFGLGQNPVLLDKKIIISLDEWFVPIKQKYPQIERAYLKVKTAKFNDSKVLDRELVTIKSKWLGR